MIWLEYGTVQSTYLLVHSQHLHALPPGVSHTPKAARDKVFKHQMLLAPVFGDFEAILSEK